MVILDPLDEPFLRSKRKWQLTKLLQSAQLTNMISLLTVMVASYTVVQGVQAEKAGNEQLTLARAAIMADNQPVLVISCRRDVESLGAAGGEVNSTPTAVYFLFRDGSAGPANWPRPSKFLVTHHFDTITTLPESYANCLLSNVGHGPAIDTRLMVDTQFYDNVNARWEATMLRTLKGPNLRSGDMYRFTLASGEESKLRLFVEPTAFAVIEQITSNSAVASAGPQRISIYEDAESNDLGHTDLEAVLYNKQFRSSLPQVRQAIRNTTGDFLIDPLPQPVGSQEVK